MLDQCIAQDDAARIILVECIASIILGEWIQGDAAGVSRKYWWWYYRVLISQLHLPKAELETKNSTKRQLMVEFLVFNSIFRKKLGLPCEIYH